MSSKMDKSFYTNDLKYQILHLLASSIHRNLKKQVLIMKKYIQD